MWDSTLTVVAAAQDRTFLSIEDLRGILEITGTSQDAKLKILNGAVAAALTAECKLKAAAGVQPTLREETLSEAFRPRYSPNRRERSPSALRLARRPVTAIGSVIENGVTLDESGYRVDGAEGELIRLSAGNDGYWAYAPITVAYTAGWAEVPDTLQRAAAEMAREWWFEDQRNPTLKSRDIPGVESVQYRWASVGDQALPQDVLDMLSEFRNPLA